MQAQGGVPGVSGARAGAGLDDPDGSLSAQHVL